MKINQKNKERIALIFSTIILLLSIIIISSKLHTQFKIGKTISIKSKENQQLFILGKAYDNATFIIIKNNKTIVNETFNKTDIAISIPVNETSGVNLSYENIVIEDIILTNITELKENITPKNITPPIPPANLTNITITNVTVIPEVVQNITVPLNATENITLPPQEPVEKKIKLKRSFIRKKLIYSNFIDESEKEINILERFLPVKIKSPDGLTSLNFKAKGNESLDIIIVSAELYKDKNISINKTKTNITTDVLFVQTFNKINATIKLKKIDNVDFILKCNKIDNEGNCLTGWEKTNIKFKDYESYIEFNVSEFSGYAGGSGFEILETCCNLNTLDGCDGKVERHSHKYYIYDDVTLCNDIYNIPNDDDRYSGVGAINFEVNNSILDCNGAVIKGSGSGNGIYIYSKHDNIIKNCNVKNYSRGINIYEHSLNNYIDRSNISFCSDAGVYVSYWSHNTIVNNSVIHDVNGLDCVSFFAQSTGSKLLNSELYNCSGRSGLHITNNDFLIKNNTIHDSRKGIDLVVSDDSNFINLKLYNNNESGIYIPGNCDNNNFVNIFSCYNNNTDISDQGKGNIFTNITCDDSYPETICDHPCPDVIFPTIFYTSHTLSDNTIINVNYIFIEVNVTDSNLNHTIFYLYNGDGSLNDSYVMSTTTSGIYSHSFTSLDNGVYYYNVTSCDVVNNCNSTETRKITLDTNPPVTNITPNGSISSLPINFILNCSDDLSGCNSTYYKIISDGSSCGSFGYSEGNSGTINTEGKRRVCFYSVDNANNAEIIKQSGLFLYDNTTPVIYFNAPTPNDEDYLNVDNFIINVTCIDDNIDSVILEWNNVNESFEHSLGNIFWSNKTDLSDGNYTIKAYCNDTSGLVSSTEIRIVTIDTTPPYYSAISTSPSSPTTYNETQQYQFNITWQDNLSGVDVVIIEHNFTGILQNYTVTTYDGDVYYYIYPTLSAGSYVYKWYANDSANNWNHTGNYEYIVNKASPVLQLNASPSWNITYSDDVTIQCNANTNQVLLKLYRDGDLVNSDYGFIGDSPDLDAGSYLYTCNTSGNQNYSSATLSNILNVSKAQSEITLYLNNTRNNISFYIWNTLNVSVELITPTDGDVEIWTTYPNNILHKLDEG